MLSKLSLKEIIFFIKIEKETKQNCPSLYFSHPMFWESKVKFRLGFRRKDVAFTEEMGWGREILLH